jgi:hypothetical protein
MLNSKYHFALAVAIAVFPVNLPKAAIAQTGYAGPYGGYYPIPGGANMAPLPSGRRSSSSSGRKYPGEYRFECERRLGIGEWKERRGEYSFDTPGYRHTDAMVKSIKSKCQSLPNP